MSSIYQMVKPQQQQKHNNYIVKSVIVHLPMMQYVVRQIGFDEKKLVF